MQNIAKNFLKEYVQPRNILLTNGTVVTLGNENKVLKNHCLSIQDGVISDMFPSGSKNVNLNDFDEVIDCSDQLIMPGFINAHTHFYSSFVRGLGKAEPSVNFEQILNNLWWRLDKKLTLEDSYYSALVAMISAIKKGTTTFIDHQASPFAVTGSLQSVGDAVLDAGLRASLCYEVSDRDGKDITMEGIEENVSWIKKCKKENNDQLKGLFGLHASFTLDPETLELCSKWGEELDTGFHVHTAEAFADQRETKRMCGDPVVQRFRDYGILGPKTICAHGVHLSHREVKHLAETNTMVVHNPQSNMNNAVGVADIIYLMEEGILVGLGTDAMTVDMLEELRSALWISHLYQDDPSQGFMECVNALTTNNAEIVKRYWGDIGIGEIKVGGVADVCTMEYYTPTPLNEDTFFGHLVFGISQASVTKNTIVGGKILYKDGKLTTIDEKKALENALELSEELWKRF